MFYIIYCFNELNGGVKTMANIQKIFEKELVDWKLINLAFFGIFPRMWEDYDNDQINEIIADDVSIHWNSESRCEVANLILDGTICKYNDRIIPGSFRLVRNHNSECIDIYAQFTPGIYVKKQAEKFIGAIPCPHEQLSWIINKTKYTPRINVARDATRIFRDDTNKRVNVWKLWYLDEEKDEIVYQRNWGYRKKAKLIELSNGEKKAKDIKKEDLDAFEYTAYDDLNDFNRTMLESIYGKKVNRDNFIDALKSLPYFERDSIYRFKYDHINLFFDIVRYSGKFASPLGAGGTTINIGNEFIKSKNKVDIYDTDNKLVISKSPIFSLENYKTAVYDTTMNTVHFSFKDTEKFFDAFKTSTSKAAGRQRLLLDNVFVKDGMMYIVGKDGKEYNMFQAYKKKDIQDSNISSISTSLFCSNDDPKRIMMTAKLTAQAIPVDGQKDDFTNRIPARVVFADYRSYNFGDSIVISESFAKRLKSHETLSSTIRRRQDIFIPIVEKLQNGDLSITKEELLEMFPDKNHIVFDSYENATVKFCDVIDENTVNLTIHVDVPFYIGDKITSLHGAKGTVGLILPDDRMPQLKNKLGVMEAGPIDVIISGYSTIRRGSLGQLFEAWANASGIEISPGEDYIKNVAKKYAKEIKEFCDNSIIEFEGEELIKPCGIIDMIRLYHNATTKVSHSFVKSNDKKLLKFAEMEKLNLAATDSNNILKELSIRSTNKYNNSYSLIKDIMEDKKLPKNAKTSLNFARIVRCMGYDILVDGKSMCESDDTQLSHFGELINDVVDDNLIDLFSTIAR